MSVWSEERIERELRTITGALGSFPSASELRSANRNDLACAIGKHGGLIAWSARLGLPRTHSDSDTGWDGEIAFAEILRSNGFAVVRSKAVKAPHDLIVDAVLRVDVKTANICTYRNCTGWFYRIGKVPQADLIALYQADTTEFYVMPWWACPTTNITITRDGGKYARFKNDLRMIRDMVGLRLAERAAIDNSVVLEVA